MYTDKPLNTPVLFLIFNRPETTLRVFEMIRKARPSKLFVVADGPRKDKPGEEDRCRLAREIIKGVNWDCEVYTNFRDENLGLKLAVSSGITWFFENVEEGIILEDDCVPSLSFFWFCQELLEKYRDDEQVMCVCGNNYQDGTQRGNSSYYFSRIVGIWGWATWRRAWKHFDIELKNFPAFKKSKQIRNIFHDRIVKRFFMTKIQDAYHGGNTWGFAWVFTVLYHNGLCITPNINLVSNCGFGPNSVHAIDTNSKLSNIPSGEIEQIIHPVSVIPDNEADEYLTKVVASEQMPKRNPMYYIKIFVRSIIGKRYYESLKRIANNK